MERSQIETAEGREALANHANEVASQIASKVFDKLEELGVKTTADGLFLTGQALTRALAAMLISGIKKENRNEETVQPAINAFVNMFRNNCEAIMSNMNSDPWGGNDD